MKKILTLLLLFTLVGFLSGNQVIITNDYQYIVSTGKTYNFNNGNPSNNVKYDRTNKIQIQNNKVIANPLKYHYAFFWQEDNTFIGYYKTNKGITTSGAYLGQVNTQSIPLPLNAYSFALVRYDNDYVLVNGYTIEELFIDNNIAGVDPDDFNDIPIAELNGLTLNELFIDNQLILNNEFDNGTNNWIAFDTSSFTVSGGIATFLPTTSTGQIRQTFNILNNNNYYFNTSVKAVSGKLVAMQLFQTASPFNSRFIQGITTNGVFQNISFLYNSTITSTNEAIRIRTQDTTAFVNIDVDYVKAYNITALGIGNLTKAQLDTYFSIYQNGVNATYYATDGNVSSRDNHYYAAGKNLFDNTTTTDFFRFANETSSTIIPAGGSFISDFIPVKFTNTYNVSGNVSGETIRVLRFDSNFNFISGNASTATSFAVGTTATTAYFRFSTAPLTSKNTIQFEVGSGATSYEAFATPTTTLNLTFLFGVGNEPNKATMDGYYAEYEEYLEYLYVCCNIFATQTISFETIYFDDGVSTEIQRLGSILIFTLIGFTLMIFGFVSRRRIFNLLSIGAFIVLGFLLVEFVGFIIILFGLVFINVYYTFFGEL